MPSRWEATQKIHSLTNIHKVTAAMNVIASLRLRPLTARLTALGIFEAGVAAWLTAMAPVLKESTSRGTTEKQARTLAVVFTSDRGLCGSHNHGIHKMLDQLAIENPHRTIEVFGVGTRGAAYARRKGHTVVEQVSVKGLTRSALDGLADEALERFAEGQVDNVVLLFNQFVSTLRQVPRRRTVLPFPEAMSDGIGCSFEGAAEQLAEESVPLLVRYQFSAALSHSLVSEQAARMTAMDSASKNARDLLNRAVKDRNRARQRGITSELMEVISGKEAMKR
jgi:F-type H+-transporting ATPase subunit gamma